MPRRVRAGDSRFAWSALSLGGIELVADRSGALYLPAERTLVVADLHLEKGSAFAVRGVMLPPYDTRETLGRLDEVISAYSPTRVVALGDSLHDVGGSDRIGREDRDTIRRLQAGREWIWIRGNHDPELGSDVGGDMADRIAIGTLDLRHEPGCAVTGAEIAGHLHPAARVTANSVGLRLRCFIGDGRRLVMPAFGAFAGGLNVLDAAFQPLFCGATVHVLGRQGIYPVSWTPLAPD